MAFKLPDEPSTQESLQCLACAGNQEINKNINSKNKYFNTNIYRYLD